MKDFEFFYTVRDLANLFTCAPSDAYVNMYLEFACWHHEIHTNPECRIITSRFHNNTSHENKIPLSFCARRKAIKINYVQQVWVYRISVQKDYYTHRVIKNLNHIVEFTRVDKSSEVQFWKRIFLFCSPCFLSVLLCKSNVENECYFLKLGSCHQVACS